MSVGLVMTIGFFGKMRSHGDFVSRRLPPEMLMPFDAWIQAWLVQSKSELGAAWLATWSTSPIWRFVLAPGLCGPQAWTGVMMPSADRVGRCFPLVLAAGLDAVPLARDCLARDAGWFAQLEALALSSLDDEFSIDGFDALLEGLEGVPPSGAVDLAVMPPDGPVVSARSGRDVPPLADAALAGRSIWWTDGSGDVAPCLALCPGLPAVASVAALLDGRWCAREWRLVF